MAYVPQSCYLNGRDRLYTDTSDGGAVARPAASPAALPPVPALAGTVGSGMRAAGLAVGWLAASVL